MSWETKPMLLKNGLPIPQYYDPVADEWKPYTDTDLKALKTDLALVKTELQTIKANQLSGDQKVQRVGTKVIRKVITIATIGAGQVQTNIITPDKPSRLVGVFSNIRTEGSPTTGDLRMDVHVGAGDLDFMSRIVRLVSAELVSTRKILTIQPSGIEANTQITLPKIEDIGGYLSHCEKFSFSQELPLVVEISNTTDRPVSNSQLRRLEVWYTSI